MISKKILFERRKKRVRFALKKKKKLDKRVRLSIYRSNTHIYAQIINDSLGQTLVSASSTEKQLISTKNNIDSAVLVGKYIAKRAEKAGVKSVIFDRGGYLFHGRIKSLAESARKNGLNF